MDMILVNVVMVKELLNMDLNKSMTNAEKIKQEVQSYLLNKRNEVHEIMNDCSDEDYEVYDSLAVMFDDARTLISERELGY